MAAGPVPQGTLVEWARRLVAYDMGLKDAGLLDETFVFLGPFDGWVGGTLILVIENEAASHNRSTTLYHDTTTTAPSGRNHSWRVRRALTSAGPSPTSTSRSVVLLPSGLLYLKVVRIWGGKR